MADDLPPDLSDATARRRREDTLLAELTEPDLDEARESQMYWLQRLDALPHHRRADRREAHGHPLEATRRRGPARPLRPRTARAGPALNIELAPQTRGG